MKLPTQLALPEIVGFAAMNLPLIDPNRVFAVDALPDGGLGMSFERRRLRFYLWQILADIGPAPVGPQSVERVGH